TPSGSPVSPSPAVGTCRRPTSGPAGTVPGQPHSSVVMGRSGSASNPSLGIVIPTVGQRPELRRMLLSIAAQTFPVATIRIVVDSADIALVDRIVTDLAAALAAIDVAIDSTGVERADGVYLVDETGHGYAMHLGVSKLDTDLVAFL